MSGATTTTANSQSNPAAIPPNVITLRQTAQLEALYTIIRDQSTSRGDFIFYSDRIIRLLVRREGSRAPGCLCRRGARWLAGWSADGAPARISACPQVEEGLNHLPVVPKTVHTPTGVQYDGVGFEGRICGVSILRSGEVRVSLRFLPSSHPTTLGGRGGVTGCGTRANVECSRRQWNKA